MPCGAEHTCFNLDSRTTSATVAFECARRLGVRSGFRTVPFLDDNRGSRQRSAATLLALRGSHKKGDAIASVNPACRERSRHCDVFYLRQKRLEFGLVFASCSLIGTECAPDRY